MILLFHGCHFNPLGGSHSQIDEANDPFLSTPLPFTLNGLLVSDSQVNLAWDAAISADDYTVVYGTSSGNYTTTVALCSHTKSQVCVVTGLMNGTTYYFNVMARNKFGTINMKNEVPAIPKPFNLFLTPQHLSALVSWGSVDNGIGNTNFTVQSGSSVNSINNSDFNVKDPHLVQNLQDGVYTYFQTIASNSAGTITSVVESVFIIDSPVAPTWPATGSVMVLGNQIILNWIASISNGTLRYSLYRKPLASMTGYAPVPGCSLIAATTCSDSTLNLQDNNNYYYMVVASNEGGISPDSTVQAALTFPNSPSGFIISATNATTNTLNWDNSLGNGDLTYQLYRDTNTPVNIIPPGNLIATVLSPFASPVNSSIDTGPSGTFVENTLYYYSLAATNASSSSTATQTTLALPSTLMTPPTNLAATSVTDNSLSLAWAFNVGNAPVVFHVYRSLTANPTDWGQPLDSGGVSVSAPYFSGLLTYQDSGLKENTNYYYMVDVLNQRSTAVAVPSTGVFSVLTTLITAPTLAVRTSDTTGITLDWSPPPSSSNGIVTYQLYRSATPITGTPSGGTALLGAGVTTPFSYKDTISTTNTNKKYWYYVTASNNSPASVSLTSNVVDVTTALTTAPTLTIGSIQTNSLTLSWTTTPAPTGLETVNYNLYRSSSGNVNTWGSPIYTGSNQSFSDDNQGAGLAENTKYYYYVTVTNNAISAQPLLSSVVSETTALQQASQFIQNQTVSKNTNITLYWNPLPNNSTITYQLYRSPSGLNTWSSNLITSAFSNTSFMDTAPVENTAYDYKLTTLNQSTVPAALASDIYTVTSDIRSLPTLNPLALNLLSNNTSSIDLTWTFPINPTTISYSVFRSLDSDPVSGNYSWSLLTGFPNNLNSVTDSNNILENTYYNYKVSASNNALAVSGSTKESPVQRILTNLTTTPNLTVSYVSNTQVTLNWNPVPSGNGNVTYKVYRSTNQPVDITVSPQCMTTTTTTVAATLVFCNDVTSVSASQTYYYAVTVTNGINTLKSKEIPVVTLPNPITTAPVITALGSNINILWQQSPGAGQSSLLTYDVLSSTDPVSNFTTLVSGIADSNGRAYDDTVITYTGLPIYYKIRARTSTGQALADSPAAGVTPIAPFSLSLATVTYSNSTTAQIVFSWPVAKGASKYEVYAGNVANGSAPPPSGTGILVASGCANRTCTLDVSANANYYYTAVASNAVLNSTATTTTSELAIPVLTPPISKLKAAPEQITITWDTILGAQSYSVSYIPVNPITCSSCLLTSQVGCTVTGVVTSSASCVIGASPSIPLTDGQLYAFTLSYVDSQSNTVVNVPVNAMPLGNFQMTSLTPSASGTSSTDVAWTPSVGADNYVVKYRIPPSTSFTTNLPAVISGTTPLGTTVNNLLTGFDYSVMVTASNTWGSVDSSEMTLRLPGGIPPGLIVNSAGTVPLSVNLGWDALPNNPPVTYNVYRSILNLNPFVPTPTNPPTAPVCTVASTASPNNVCTDKTALVENQIYYYVLTAKNTAGESSPSSSVTATSALVTRPAFTTASKIAYNSLRLNWPAANNNGIVSYNIYRFDNSTSIWPTAPLNNSPIIIDPVSQAIGSFTDSAHLTQNTKYKYQISVSNAALGQSPLYSDQNYNNPTSPLTVTTLLNDPVTLTINNFTASSVNLSWTPAAGTEPVTYRLYRQLKGDGNNWTGPLNSQTPTALSYVDNDPNLVANTQYTYKITVTDSVLGSKELSDITDSIKSITTALDAPPTIKTTNAIDSTHIKLTWDKPPGSAQITYTVARANSACSLTPLNWNTAVSVLPSDPFAFTDSLLTPNTTYCYKLNALQGATSLSSSPVAATTDLTAGPVINSRQAQSIPLQNTLNWNSYAGTGVVTFSVFRQNDSGDWVSLSNSATSPFSDKNIQENFLYTYKVSAQNNSGSGVVHETPLPAFYSALQTPISFDEKQTTVTDSQINLSWSKATGGSVGAIDYRLYRVVPGVPPVISLIYTSNSLTTTAVPATGAGITSFWDGVTPAPALTQNTVYTYRLSTKNTAPNAVELFSNPDYAVVTDLSSNFPPLLSFASVPPIGSSSVALKWTPSATGAAYGLVTYQVSQSSDATGNQGTWGSAILDCTTSGSSPKNNCIVGNLLENKKYVFKLSAFNNSLTPTTHDSALVTVTTALATALATAPTLEQVSGSANPLTFRWDKVKGDQDVIYKLYRSENSNGTVTAADTMICTNSTASQCSDTNSPKASIKYNYAVIVSSVSNSATVSSNIIPITTAPHPLATAPTLSAIEGNVTISWPQSPSADTPSLLSYKVERSTNDPIFTNPSTVSGCDAVPDSGAAVTTCPGADTVTANGSTIYYYRVTAMTAGGNAAASPVAAITPISPITDFKAAVTAGTSISLTWSGGLGATTFQVYKSSLETSAPGDANSTPLVCSAQPCTDTGSIGTPYYYYVVANNGASPINLAKTTSAQLTVTPSIPVTLTATADTGQITLSWDPVPNASTYFLYYIASPNDALTSSTIFTVTTQNGNFGKQSLDVLQLTNGTAYNFVLKTLLQSGAVVYSSSVTATPIGAVTISSISPTETTMQVNWNNAVGAKSYTVSYATATTGYGRPVSAGANFNKEIISLIPGNLYFVKVAAINNNGSVSSPRSATVTIPSPPSSIRVVSAGYNNAVLEWDNNTTTTPNVVYKVYRNPASSSSPITINDVLACWNEVSAITPNRVSCTDNGIQNSPPSTTFTKLAPMAENTKYSYQIVTATNPVIIAPVGSVAGFTIPTKLSPASSPVLVITDLNPLEDKFTFNSNSITPTANSASFKWRLDLGKGAGRENMECQILYKIKGYPNYNSYSWYPCAPATDNTSPVDTLYSNTKYDLQIQVRNKSPFPTIVQSNVQSFTTLFYSTSSFDVDVPSVTDTTATLNWKFGIGDPNAKVNFTIKQNGTALSGASISSCSSSLNNVAPSTTTNLSCVVTGLSPNTKYKYTLVATSVDNSNSTLSSTDTIATTKFALNINRVVLTQSSATAHSITLNWTMPVGDGLVDYRIITKTPTNGSVTTTFLGCSLLGRTPTSGSTVETCTVSGLQPNTDYIFNVVATNRATGATTTTGSGDLTATTDFDTSKIYSLVESNVSDTSVTLSWNFAIGTSLVDFSVAVDGITIPRSQKSGIFLSNCNVLGIDPSTNPALSCQVNGLNQNTSYKFQVTATDKTSAIPSSSLTVITALSTAAPGALFKLEAVSPGFTPDLLSGVLTLSWNFNIGSAPVDFSFDLSNSNFNIGNGACTLKGVTPGVNVKISCTSEMRNFNPPTTHYLFQIKAKNRSTANASVSSNKLDLYLGTIISLPFSTPITASRIDNALYAKTKSLYVKPGQMQMSWTLNQGKDNVNYQLQSRNTDTTGAVFSNWPLAQVSSCIPSNALTAAQTPGTEVTCTLTSLIENSNYQFSVIATGAKNSTYTVTSNALNVLTPPVTAPSMGLVTIPTSHSIQVSWPAATAVAPYGMGTNQNYSYNVYALNSAGTPTHSGILFCSAAHTEGMNPTSCSSTQYDGNNLTIGATYSFALSVQNTSTALSNTSPLSTVTSALFSKPVNTTTPSDIAPSGGAAISSTSGIVSASSGTLTGNLGAWSDPSNCSFSWYRNNALIPNNTGSTYTLQPNDQCAVFSYCVTCFNGLGPSSGSTDLSTTTCNLKSTSPSTNGISTAGIISAYASRVKSVKGSALTSAGQSQIQNFLNQCITEIPSIPFPDVMYAMRSYQNAGYGTRGNNVLYDLFCDAHNATLASTSLTWNTNGILGDSKKSPHGMADSNSSLFNSNNPSTLVAYAQTPESFLNQYQGVMGYDSTTLTAQAESGMGYGMNINSKNLFDALTLTPFTKKLSTGGSDFFARSLSGFGTVIDFSGNQVSPTNNVSAFGVGKFHLGSLPLMGRANNNTLNSYMPFAAAWTNLALSFDQMESVRNNYLMNLNLKRPVIGTADGKLIMGCTLQSGDISCPSNATVWSSGNSFGINGITIANNQAYLTIPNLKQMLNCPFNGNTIGTCVGNGIFSNFKMNSSGLIYKGYAYLANKASINKCQLNGDGSISNVCDKAVNFGSSYLGLNQFNGIIYAGDSNQLKICTQDSSNGNLACNNSNRIGTRPLVSMAFYTTLNGNTIGYFSNIDKNIYSYEISSSDGSLSSSLYDTFGTNIDFGSIIPNNGYLYANDHSAAKIISKCLITPSTGMLSNCSAQSSISIGGQSYIPTAIGFY
ncbi:fibronectin type III domain-containing protein [Silvanigrella aquatica]|uniref:fibronectin type III domain-containing protein n=1 Tax=Silvanigrella aquatica TaxID=1915309 RepID=UPI0011E5B542|nr:fibronectin type III domain-containing protein [Silvanigrella aquatica]